MLFFFPQAEKKHKSFEELDRFMHYYTRFKNHEHSYEVTHPLQTNPKFLKQLFVRKISLPNIFMH